MNSLKTLFYRMCLPLAALSLQGCDRCDPEPEPPITVKVSTESVQFDVDGGEKNVTITSNGKWVVEVTNDSKANEALTVLPQEGSGDGSITITAPKNPKTDELKSTVTVKVKDVHGVVSDSKSITVTQKGVEKYINVKPNILEFDNREGTQNVKVEANVDWGVSPSSDSWCQGEKYSNELLKVTVQPNTSIEERESTITLKDSDGTTTCTVNVKQAGANGVITVLPTPIEFDPDGGNQNLTVESNAEWEATPNANWCTIDKTGKQKGNATVKVMVEQIASETGRSTTISFKCGTQTENVTVTQKGIELKASTESLTSMKAEGESRDITVTSNTEWTIASNETWCTPNISSGKGNSVVSITVGKNATTLQRSAIITLAAKNAPSIKRTINVTQDAAGIILEVTPTSHNFKADGETKSVSVTCNTDWTMTSDQSSWCSVSKASENNGTITTAKNPTTSQRFAKVTFKAGSKTATVNITQDPQGAPVVTPSSLMFEADGGSKNVSLSCNTGWMATSSASWCTLSKTSGTGDVTIAVTAAKNTATTDREAIITLKAENGLSTKITVTQKGAPVILTVTPASQTFKDAGGSGSLTVESNTNWTASSSETWCRIGKNSGTGNGTIALTIDKNETINQREATITVKTGTLTRTATITQEGTVVILQVTGTSFDADGGTKNISVTCNTDWTASSNQTWCRLGKTSGSGNGTIALTIDKNETVNQRTATVTVKAGALTRTATITQKGIDVILQVTGTSFDANGGTKNISVTCNTDWTASSSETWCTLGKTSGTGNNSIALTVSKNTSTSSREATITVKAGSKTEKATVTQSGPGIILTINPTSLSFEADGSSKTVSVTSNTSWKVSSSQSWCTVSTSSGSNNGSVTVTAAKNPNTSSRTATVTFEATNGGAKVSLIVTQKETVVVPHTYATPTSLSFGHNVSSQTISVTSNESWTASSSNSMWCTLSPVYGSNDGTVTVTVGANTTRSKRTATITVTGSSSGDKTTITVTQEVNSPGEDDNLPPTAPARRKK